MIQFRQETVWVREPGGKLLPFDSRRLSSSVNRAAELAGNHDSAIGESLAAAVEVFALRLPDHRVISTADIAQFVVTVLNSIGFSTIASLYGHRSQHVEIQLDDMAARVATGFDLAFYQQLDEALGVAGDQQKTLIQLRGLRQCVLTLRGAQRWCQRCRRLADEIVEHVRVRAAHLRSCPAPSLHLTVIE